MTCRTNAVILAGCAALAALAVGCQSGNHEPPPVATPPPGDAAGDAAGDAPGGAPRDAAADAAAQPARVALPKSPATPPHRTTRPLARKELDRLAAFAFTDFTHDGFATTRFAQIKHRTRTRPILSVTARIEPCDRSKRARRPCLPMKLAPWQARAAALKREMDPVLAARPDTRFEVGAIELAGSPAIFSYQLGWYFGPDEHGQQAGTYSDAYILRYNDGINQIQVTAAYVDDAVGSAQQLIQLAPPEDLETLALAFASFYVHEWK